MKTREQGAKAELMGQKGKVESGAQLLEAETGGPMGLAELVA